MSAFPVALEGEAIRALVVGGGRVAARKLAALLESGAEVVVVAPELSPECVALRRTGRWSWRRWARHTSSGVVWANSGLRKRVADSVMNAGGSWPKNARTRSSVI